MVSASGYANQCSRAHIDYPTREYLIGHKLPGQEPSYNRMTEEDRLNEFVNAIPLLTIDPSANLKDRVKELEGEQAQRLAEQSKKISLQEQKIEEQTRALYTIQQQFVRYMDRDRIREEERTGEPSDRENEGKTWNWG